MRGRRLAAPCQTLGIKQDQKRAPAKPTPSRQESPQRAGKNAGASWRYHLFRRPLYDSGTMARVTGRRVERRFTELHERGADESVIGPASW